MLWIHVDLVMYSVVMYDEHSKNRDDTHKAILLYTRLWADLSLSELEQHYLKVCIAGKGFNGVHVS